MRKLFVPILLVLMPLVVAAQGVDPWKNRAVISVVDGDTVVLDNGEVVRLIGLLTPQAKHGKQEAEPYGDQARNFVEDMLLGQQVEISFDRANGGSGHRDKFGRALCYLTITRSAEKEFVNLVLLKKGIGYYAPTADDLEFGEVLKSAEADARKAKVGVWEKNDKSPQEIATAAGKTFEERPSSISLIYIRPITPILQGPGVSTQVAVNRPPTNSGGKHSSMDMEDLRKTGPVTPKKADAVADPDAGLYDIKQRQVFYSTFDEDQKLEMYRATTGVNDTDYRLGIRQGDKEIIFITSFNGMKNFEKLLAKGTESQPVLTSVETTVGSINGERGTINVSSGKDGGIVLNVTGKAGSSRFFVNRQSAFKMQIAIGSLVP